MTDESVTAAVPDELAGLRLDQALAEMFPDWSRSRLKKWLLDGAVTVDGAVMKPRDRVAGGEHVVVNAPGEVAVVSRPESIDLTVALEDDDFLVIDKPAGLVVHPGAGNTHGTLMNGLLHRAPGLAALPRAGIVHRLDKDTSGLLLVAKTLPAHNSLVHALAEREISRQYLAVCNGVLTGGATIDAPLDRHPVDRKRMAVREGGRPAVTRYVVVERFAAHTLVRVSLETGRTHQIRVHFAYRRRPLFGDPVYGGRLAIPAGADERLATVLRGFRRQALHATRLEFAHPTTGETVIVESRPPDDFERLVTALRGDS